MVVRRTRGSHIIANSAPSVLQYSAFIVVILSVCLSVCYQSSASVRRACDKLDLPARSSLNSQGFQLADFAKTLSFPSYSFFFI